MVDKKLSFEEVQAFERERLKREQKEQQKAEEKPVIEKIEKSKK